MGVPSVTSKVIASHGGVSRLEFIPAVTSIVYVPRPLTDEEYKLPVLLLKSMLSAEREDPRTLQE
jgi:hypothetical protein